MNDITALYDDPFYSTRERYRAVYDHFAAWLFERYAPSRVVDIGSGAGYLLSGFATRGCTVLGVEGSGSAFQNIPGNIPTLYFDLRNADRLAVMIQPYWDLAASVEVVEHLDEACEDAFCRLLASLTSKTLFFTAAPAGKPPLHVNCKPKEYWVAKMEGLGLRYQREAVDQFTADCSAHGCIWVVQNAMIFTRY
ncbi:MAG: methyltransferase domain-containing protein [Planctomycetaceae bacterium]|nr:class I SAM-dependent methyltransferase [Planctomycetaceae bacterium]